MATRLHQVITFLSVPADGSVTLPHSINVNEVPTVPDLVFQDNAGFTIISVSPTDITVRNDNGVAATLDVWLFVLHSIERAFGAVQIAGLTPRPFVVTGGSANGGNIERFKYTATGLEGPIFTINFPVPRANTNYAVQVSGGGLSSLLVFDTPVANYTVNGFEVIASGAPQAGDVLIVTVGDLI